MSKKKFRLLMGFMIFSLFSLITVVAIEVNNYILANNRYNTIVQENKKESSNSGITVNKIEHETSLKEVDKSDVMDGDNAQDDKTIKDEASLMFAGDVLLSEFHLEQYDKKASVKGILSDEVLNLMYNADIMMVNQEFPFSTRGNKMDDKQYTFRVNPSRAHIFNEMGIDVVTLANNHTLDYGIDALLDTVTTLDRAQIKHIGAGSNLEEAKEPSIIEINNKKIAFLGASRVIPVYEWNATNEKAGLFTTYDPTSLIEEIKEAKRENDLVIVYVHWGIERAEYPKEYQRELGKKYIDAGADVVVGSHPHVLQGIEYYNEKPIIYSLGNYVFGTRTYQTMLLNIQVDKNNDIEISIIPCLSQNGYLTIKDKKTWKVFYSYLEKISYNTNIDDEGLVKQSD